jgi:hypothetical protein
MCMLDHRVQILLDDERYQKVSREATARGISIAAVIRDAIDHIPVSTDQRRAAIAAILDAPAMPVPEDPADLRREREDARSRSLT